MNLLIYVRHKILLFPAGCRLQMRSELGLYSLHSLLMVFVAQVVRCELVS
jgi:hypothetical protein